MTSKKLKVKLPGQPGQLTDKEEFWKNVQHHSIKFNSASPNLKTRVAPSTEPLDDVTMSFPSGSAVFKVGGRMFKIPKALLHQHSEGLLAMFDLNGSEDDHVVLDDPIEGFIAFRCALFTPSESVLYRADLTPADLPTILHLLTFAYKYSVADIEKHALKKALLFTNTPPMHLIPQILGIGRSINSDQLSAQARQIMLQQIRDHPSKTIIALKFGEDIEDRVIIGAALYSIMITGYEAWSTNSALSADHKQRLTRGMLRCVQRWDRIQTEWFTSSPCCHTGDCATFSRFFGNLVKQYERQKIAWCDVVSKVSSVQCVPPIQHFEVMLLFNPPPPHDISACWKRIQAAGQALEPVLQGEIASFFLA